MNHQTSPLTLSDNAVISDVLTVPVEAAQYHKGPGPVVMGSDASILPVISQPTVTMAIWQRQHLSPTTDLCRTLAALPVEQQPHGRFTSDWRDCANSLEGLYRNPARDSGEIITRQQLADDVARLAMMFHRITGVDELETRLQVIRHDACQFWHIDNVEYRLICTYHGPGTQWVTPNYAQQALDQRDRWDGPSNSLAPGDVSIFNGARQQHAAGIVHRSPPIKAKGGVRLVLCLNVASGEHR